MKKSSRVNYSIYPVIFAGLGLAAWLVLSIWLVITRGLVGAVFTLDFIAGIIVFATALIGTKSNPSMRSLIMSAILFFVLARVIQVQII